MLKPHRPLALAATLLAACGGARPSPTAPAPATTVEVSSGTGGVEPSAAPADDGPIDPGPIPVGPADPTWGSPRAPVTLVVFGDFQCPFCARSAPVLADLERIYGPEELRVVWKNEPLPFHANARPAAEAAEAVHQLGGAPAFWKFFASAFAHQGALSAEAYEAWARDAGVSVEAFRRLVEAHAAAAKIDDDIALARAIGANGTPHFYVNGALIAGYHPTESIRATIDVERAKAQALLEAGMPRGKLYASLTRANLKVPAPAPPPADDDAPDTTPLLAPVAGSPVRGPADALVTVVEFGDFQCPFCKRVQPTLDELRRKYGAKLRIVWKNQPLPFHPHAEPAAELALEARAEKGDDGFFRAHDAIFASSPKLDDADLEDIAKQLGLDVGRARAAMAKHAYKAAIAADQDLADDLRANGTPTFFVNGRKLVGAQPLDKFVALVDEEMAKAEALVARGVPARSVYAELQKSAKNPALEVERKSLPAPTAANPSRGAPAAKVVIQEFSDFQCPFCKRANETLAQILKEYPGKVRIVWRNLPLPFHQHAELAAEAAAEAFRQRGNAGFWRMHDLMFEHQADPGGLDRAALVGYAQTVGLDVARFERALDSREHEASVKGDAKLAEDSGIQGTPGFVINGMFLSGAQPFAKFRRLIDRTLAETK